MQTDRIDPIRKGKRLAANLGFRGQNRPRFASRHEPSIRPIGAIGEALPDKTGRRDHLHRRPRKPHQRKLKPAASILNDRPRHEGCRRIPRRIVIERAVRLEVGRGNKEVEPLDLPSHRLPEEFRLLWAHRSSPHALAVRIPWMHSDPHSRFEAKLNRLSGCFPRPCMFTRADIGRSGEVQKLTVEPKTLANIDVQVDPLQSRFPSRASNSDAEIDSN